jgi:hypothetical protein
VSEAVYNAQAAATPTPSEREIVSANNRRAQARLAEARSSQPTLNIGEFECLPDNAGIRVCLTVSTPGRFTVLHNVRVEAGGKILFQYSECWSMSSSKSQWDYFCIPVHLRGTRYKSVTQIWIERQLIGDDRASYKLGRMSEDDDGGTDPDTPWGATYGRWALRTVPPLTTPICRETILQWDDDGVMRQPIEIVPRRSCAIGIDVDGRPFKLSKRACHHRNISRRRRRAFPAPSAVVVFETFSFPPTIPIFPTVLMNTAKSVTLTVFCINVRVRGH